MNQKDREKQILCVNEMFYAPFVAIHALSCITAVVATALQNIISRANNTADLPTRSA
jgi:hypothetical protein